MTETTPDFDPSRAVDVGRIGPAHGIKGELRVESLSDFPDRFRRGARLWLDGRPLLIESSRLQGQTVLLKLEGIDDRNTAETLRGKILQTPELHTIYTAGTYFQHDIVGLETVTESGEVLGRVISVLETGANDVYLVKGERGELLLPAIEDVIKQVDVRNGKLVVDVLPGLEFIKPTRGGQRPRSKYPTSDEKRAQGAAPPKSPAAIDEPDANDDESDEDFDTDADDTEDA